MPGPDETATLQPRHSIGRRHLLLLAMGAASTATILGVRASGISLEGVAPPDLSQFTLTFNEDFDTLDVSARGPGTRWTAHTPWNGDFGDAQFTDPQPGFPFTVKDGVLRIEARKGDDGKWRSGLLSSVNPDNEGFSQQYGYFEMRAKLPPGPGLWPAFWLGTMTPKDSLDSGIEIDVIEHYGKFPQAYESHVIIWPKVDQSKKWSTRKVKDVTTGTLYSDFHIYSVLVEPDWITMYFDNVPYWRVATPPEHKNKLLILVNLAMGSGWPIDQTPNPSYMYVDYIRAYARR